jgi:AcrR family transcriptional regulator
MARVNKRPQDRRTELLDCAQALFFEKGYEGTTINDIMGRAGVSKGGFYHHFSAKEEVLEALSARFATQSVEQVRGILDDPGLDALGRLNAFLAASRRLKVKDADALRATFDAVFKPENIVLYYRLNRAVTAVMVPIIAGILAQGRSEGRFRIGDPAITAELILQLGAATHDAVARAIAVIGEEEQAAAAVEFEERLRQQGIAMDRILGLPDGSITFVEPGFGAAILASRPTRESRSA